MFMTHKNGDCENISKLAKKDSPPPAKQGLIPGDCSWGAFPIPKHSVCWVCRIRSISSVAFPHIIFVFVYLWLYGHFTSRMDTWTYYTILYYTLQTGKRVYLFVSCHFHNAAIMRVVNLRPACWRFHWQVISVDQHSINILISCLYAVCQADNAIWL